MIRNASFWRKVIYLVLMIPTLIVLALLGLPTTLDEKGEVKMRGKLAQLRTEYELSQASLGDIDPASETMKLATLGLRPVAANILWDKANEFKKKQAWDALSATLNQISKLQPNFISVWEFQAHNLSYNVSVEFDDYRQRYHWVIKGIEFLLVGAQYNRNEPKLPWNLGWFIGQKIGRADEKKEFREMFPRDKDFHDELIKHVAVDSIEAQGPDGRPDNWKVSRLWYLIALDLADDKNAKASDLNLWRQTRAKVGGQIEAETQKGRSALLIHVDPAMSLINYAGAIQEEGRVGEVAQIAWKSAGKGWEEFGRQPIRSSWGQSLFLNSVEKNQEELAALTAELDALAPGERRRLFDERAAKLPTEQRALLDLKETEVPPAKGPDYYQARQATIVTHDEVAELAPMASQAKARRLAAKINDLDLLTTRTIRYREQVNYNYWKTRCEAESSDESVRARRNLFDAQMLLKKGDLQASHDAFEAAWQDWATVLDTYPLLLDGITAQDLVDPLKRYKDLLNQMGESDYPKDFKLNKVLDINREKGRLPGAPTAKPETTKPASENGTGDKPDAGKAAPPEGKPPEGKDADDKNGDKKKPANDNAVE